MIFITKEEELQMDLPLQCLYFYGSWMPYHKKLITIINKMQEKYEDISFFAIDVDQFPNQCTRFSIESVPTMLVLRQGKEIKRINGVILTSAFRSALSDICNINGESHVKEN
jgi:thioredoxin-like negative regulator of GroEL